MILTNVLQSEFLAMMSCLRWSFLLRQAGLLRLCTKSKSILNKMSSSYSICEVSFSPELNKLIEDKLLWSRLMEVDRHYYWTLDFFFSWTLVICWQCVSFDYHRATHLGMANVRCCKTPFVTCTNMDHPILIFRTVSRSIQTPLPSTQSPNSRVLLHSLSLQPGLFLRGQKRRRREKSTQKSSFISRPCRLKTIVTTWK